MDSSPQELVAEPLTDLTLHEAAEQYAVSARTLAQHIRCGQLPAYKTAGATGPQWRVTREALDAAEYPRRTGRPRTVRSTPSSWSSGGSSPLPGVPLPPNVVERRMPTADWATRCSSADACAPPSPPPVEALPRRWTSRLTRPGG